MSQFLIRYFYLVNTTAKEITKKKSLNSLLGISIIMFPLHHLHIVSLSQFLIRYFYHVQSTAIDPINGVSLNSLLGISIEIVKSIAN